MSISTTDYYKIIITHFEEMASPTDAMAMAQYMRNQYAFFGIRAPINKAIQKIIFTEYGLPTVEQLPDLLDLLWADEHREIQLFGLDLMKKLIKKVDKSFIDVLEKLIITKSWWDTVDMLAANLTASLVKQFPELSPEYPDKWMDSGNIWLQRTAIIYQLKYKEETDIELLLSYILRLKDSKEFFIQKAAGWALREYSKTDWQLVLGFIEEHELAPLTKREGLKWMKKNGAL